MRSTKRHYHKSYWRLILKQADKYRPFPRRITMLQTFPKIRKPQA